MENNFETTICPACSVIARFGDKWLLRILVLLDREGVLRFNELQKKIPGISQKVLTSTLQTLENYKLIHRKVYPEVPPRVEYRLTGLGKSLMQPLQTLVEWALEHADELNGTGE